MNKPEGFTEWITKAQIHGKPAVLVLEDEIKEVISQRDQLLAACNEALAYLERKHHLDLDGRIYRRIVNQLIAVTK